MAATLSISPNTVKTHLRSIYQKTGVASRSEAIERAVELRLLLGPSCDDACLCCQVSPRR